MLLPFLPTLSATDLKTMYERAELVRWIQGQAHNGANVLGIYSSSLHEPGLPGAQALEHVRILFPAEYLPLFDTCGDVLWIVLIAPRVARGNGLHPGVRPPGDCPSLRTLPTQL